MSEVKRLIVRISLLKNFCLKQVFEMIQRLLQLNRIDEKFDRGVLHSPLVLSLWFPVCRVYTLEYLFVHRPGLSPPRGMGWWRCYATGGSGEES